MHIARDERGHALAAVGTANAFAELDICARARGYYLIGFIMRSGARLLPAGGQIILN